MEQSEKKSEIKFETPAEMYARLELEARAGGGKKSWWFKITQKRWRGSWRPLEPAERVVMLSLWLYAGRRADCWPSVRKLAAELGISKTTISKIILQLEKKEFIRTEKKRGHTGKRNHYFLLK